MIDWLRATWSRLTRWVAGRAEELSDLGDEEVASDAARAARMRDAVFMLENGVCPRCGGDSVAIHGLLSLDEEYACRCGWRCAGVEVDAARTARGHGAWKQRLS